MKLLDYVENLQSNGRYTFNSQDIRKALYSSSDIALKNALRRLKAKGLLANPVQGFYVIVPPEYRKAGCLPPEQFIHELMHYLKGHYYVGLLTAAQLYGAAHQKPQIFQVITDQKRRDISCGNFIISFTTKSDINKVLLQQFKTPRGYYLASSPELTAQDLLLYVEHSAGINNVLTVLSELVESLDVKKLLQLVDTSKNIVWAQRLGFLLDFIGAKNLGDELHKKIKDFRVQRRYLLPGYPLKKKAKLDTKWNLLVNAELESDI